jgi:hypothetical protein
MKPETGPEAELRDLEQALCDAETYGIVQTDCPYGCLVEPDGVCPHGYASPLYGMGC